MADGIELGAVERLLGNAAPAKTAMSSTKSSIGHLLGAAGAVEAIFCLLAMRDGIVPPTINLENPDVATALDLVPHKAKKRDVNVAMSNSFGFGGTNAALIFSKVLMRRFLSHSRSLLRRDRGGRGGMGQCRLGCAGPGGADRATKPWS